MFVIKLTFPGASTRWATSKGDTDNKADAELFQSHDDAAFELSRRDFGHWTAEIERA